LSQAKKTHQRSRSDATGVLKLGHRRSPSNGSNKNCMGDLNSGRAFDNGCVCFDSTGPDFVRKTACTCHAPRLLPQLEFIKGKPPSTHHPPGRLMSLSIVWQTIVLPAVRRRVDCPRRSLSDDGGEACESNQTRAAIVSL
jgi:hypothetical protein